MRVFHGMQMLCVLGFVVALGSSGWATFGGCPELSRLATCRCNRSAPETALETLATQVDGTLLQSDTAVIRLDTRGVIADFKGVCGSRHADGLPLLRTGSRPLQKILGSAARWW